MRKIHDFTTIYINSRRTLTKYFEITITSKNHRDLCKNIICRTCMLKLRACHISDKDISFHRCYRAVCFYNHLSQHYILRIKRNYAQIPRRWNDNKFVCIAN